METLALPINSTPIEIPPQNLEICRYELILKSELLNRIPDNAGTLPSYVDDEYDNLPFTAVVCATRDMRVSSVSLIGTNPLPKMPSQSDYKENKYYRWIARTAKQTNRDFLNGRVPHYYYQSIDIDNTTSLPALTYRPDNAFNNFFDPVIAKYPPEVAGKSAVGYVIDEINRLSQRFTKNIRDQRVQSSPFYSIKYLPSRL